MTDTTVFAMISKMTSDQGESPVPTGSQLTVSESQDSDYKEYKEISEKYIIDYSTVEAGDLGKSSKDESRCGSDDSEFASVLQRRTAAEKVDKMSEIGLYALHVEDDPSLNPWTFRTWFIGELPRFNIASTGSGLAAAIRAKDN